MRLVKCGHVPKSLTWDAWKARVTCKKQDKYDSKGCEAVLEITVGDLVMLYWKGTHFTHYYAAVKCPCCGKHNAVELSDTIWKRFNVYANRRKAIFDGFSDR